MRVGGGGGGFLTIGYSSRTMGYYFPYCFLENFCERGQSLDGEGQSRDGGSPSPPPPTRENLGTGIMNLGIPSRASKTTYITYININFLQNTGKIQLSMDPLMEEDKVMMGGSPSPPPPLGKTLEPIWQYLPELQKQHTSI